MDGSQYACLPSGTGSATFKLSTGEKIVITVKQIPNKRRDMQNLFKEGKLTSANAIRIRHGEVYYYCPLRFTTAHPVYTNNQAMFTFDKQNGHVKQKWCQETDEIIDFEHGQPLIGYVKPTPNHPYKHLKTIIAQFPEESHEFNPACDT